MRWFLALCCLSTVARATPGPAPIVGGSKANAGEWPDVAAVLLRSGAGDNEECTGTLIAPTVVITAGHCNDPGVDNVLIGTTSLTDGTGQTIPVMQRIEYPNSQSSIDVTLLVLASAATEAPRSIATGWATVDIKNGAPIELVGYGATDANASVYPTDLMEVMSSITDFDCTEKSGCNAGAMPDGELGAGGGGIDTCSGDSGGPLYLLTSYGTFLAGVTSRSYDDATAPCGGGGIYERPDKIVSWAEQQTGVAMARGPEPTPGIVTGVSTGPVEFHLDPNDPLSSDHTFALTQPPQHGMAVVRDDGEVRVCLDDSGATDAIGVTITDSHDATRSIEWVLLIEPTSGDAPASCDPSAFDSKEAGGCCDAGRSPAGSLPLALGVLVLLRRRKC